MFEISSIAVADTSKLHLRSADGDLLYRGAGAEKKAVQVVLYGPGSEQYQKAQAKQNSATMQRMRTKGKIDRSAEELRADRAALLASCTAGFENLSYAPAADASGRELYLAIYSDPKIGFVADQVNEHLGDWANFLPVLPTS